MSAPVDTKIWIQQPSGKITFYSAAPKARIPAIVAQARRLGYTRDVLVTKLTDDPRTFTDGQMKAARKRAAFD